MKTTFQSAINTIKANKDTIIRKTTVAVGVSAGMLIAGTLVDKLRKSAKDDTVTGPLTFDAPSDENPFNTL